MNPTVMYESDMFVLWLYCCIFSFFSLALLTKFIYKGCYLFPLYNYLVLCVFFVF